MSQTTNLEVKGSTNNNDDNPIAALAVPAPTINIHDFQIFVV